jgi:hypothetical protein
LFSSPFLFLFLFPSSPPFSALSALGFSSIAKNPPQTLMTGIEPMLKELCQKMSNIENKLTRLDNIEARLNSMESKFNAYDSDILS